MTTGRHHRCRGFTLLELMGALILLAVFSLISARLFTAMIRHIRDGTASQNAANVFTAAISQLRADVWSADKLQGDGPTLILTYGPRVVTWAANPAGLSRTETDAAATPATRRWDNIPATVSFSVDRNVVGVRVDAKNAAPDVIPMSSEAIALKGDAQ